MATNTALLQSNVNNSLNPEEKSRNANDEHAFEAGDCVYTKPMIEYAFNAYHRIPQEERSKITPLFDTTDPDQFRESIIGYCNKTAQSHVVFNELCNTANQYDTFKQLQSDLLKQQRS
eukprot:1051140_1